MTGLDPQMAGPNAPATPSAAQPVAPSLAPGPGAVLVTLTPLSAQAGIAPIVVDPLAVGTGTNVGLRWFDDERAVLEHSDADGPAVQVRILPPNSAGAVPAASGVVRREVVVDGWRMEVDIELASRAALRDQARRGRSTIDRSGPIEVRAMIPGVVVSVAVGSGEAVAAGQRLVVLEAMKMQNEILAPRDGTIERVEVVPGSKIELGDLLLVIG